MTAPRFLIVRLSAIGDVIHTLPALMDLRSAFPESEVDWQMIEKVLGFAVKLVL